ncbi:MAG: CHAD domain-containing protein [Synechococcaceae cyanobacterium]
MPILNGDHAHGLIAQHCRQLVELQGPVLDDRDPEPLRQMDLSLRRLHRCLVQFEAALELPQAVSAKRLGKTQRRLAMTRDLDRLQTRLEAAFLPQAPERELRRLKPVLRQLKRERQLAHDHLVSALRSSGHLEQLAQLQGWLREPRYTALGTEPLAEWLLEWAGDPAPLLLHRGWWVRERGEELASLRDLGERIEGLADQLDNLPQPGTTGHHRWRLQLQRGQALLAELNDLEVLRKALDEQLRDGIERTVPQLDWLLEQHRLQCWRQWRDLAETLLAAPQRRRRPLLRLAAWQGRSVPDRIRAALISLAARLL